MNWNDLKYLLAVARSGTLAGASEMVRADPTTVSRRLTLLEEELGAGLFLRVDGRYVATEMGENILAHAEQVEQQTAAIERAVTDQDLSLSGEVRLTSVATIVGGYLIPRIEEFRRRYPDITLEMIADGNQLNLSRREADLALRMVRPQKGNVLTRRISTVACAVYASPELAEQSRKVGLEGCPWVDYDDLYAHLPEAQWVINNYPARKTALRLAVGPTMHAALREGVGVGVLACYLGDADDSLVRLTPTIVRRDLWLLVHPELRHVPRISRVIEWLDEIITEDRKLFEGLIKEVA